MLTQVDYTQPIEYYTEPIQHTPTRYTIKIHPVGKCVDNV